MAEAHANVTLEKFAIVFNGRDPMVLDFSKPHDQTIFEVEEGATYRIQLTFRVQNDIVSGLRYHQLIKYKGIKGEKMTLMIGSYGPKEEPYTLTLDEEQEVPKGMMYRGRYDVYSKVLDDDKNVIKEFSWAFNINRSWD